LREEEKADMKITRRNALKSGLLIGGLGLGGKLAKADGSYIDTCPVNCDTYFDELETYIPGQEPLGSEEMRITFLGTWYAERISQACNSIFVELGNGDNFVFDFGPGVLAKYNAMGIPQSKLNKVFLTHLHADHMTELGMLYGFGSSYGRMQPLYVWGQKPSGIPDPYDPSHTYDDGVKAYCHNLREAFRWHTESQSFLATELVSGSWTPPSWAPQDKVDSYDLVPFELDWTLNPGIAYNDNDHGVTITHFPSVHCRAGSMAYKLAWNGLSMIFTGDTKPNWYAIQQANGVDVLIHEMTTSPEVWTECLTGLTPSDGTAWTNALAATTAVQQSSHTVDKAFGYVLSQIAKHPSKAPRLAVATHFPASDSTIRPSLANVRAWYPKGNVIVALDLTVLIVSKEKIDVRRAVVPEFTWPLIVNSPSGTTAPAKYSTPTMQLDPTQLANTIDSSVYGPEV
jgi:ribonuclease Z